MQEKFDEKRRTLFTGGVRHYSMNLAALLEIEYRKGGVDRETLAEIIGQTLEESINTFADATDSQIEIANEVMCAEAMASHAMLESMIEGKGDENVM